MSKAIVREKIKVSKAQIADVKFGKRIIQGLMLPSGEFAIAVPQVQILYPNLISLTGATKSVKTLLGKDSNLFSVSSEIAKRAVNAISRI